jgi:hypothetical protein
MPLNRSKPGKLGEIQKKPAGSRGLSINMQIFEKNSKISPKRFELGSSW